MEHHFPELQGKISGGNYPVPPTIELLSTILSIFQLTGIIIAITGDSLFQLFGRQTAPGWFQNVVMKNSIVIMIALYLIIPGYLNSYIVSGAFEIVLDETEIVFSKIATGRMPQAQELIASLTKAGLAYAENA